MKNYLKHVERTEDGKIRQQSMVVFDDSDPVARAAAVQAVADAPSHRSVFRAFPGYSGPVVGQGGGF